MCIPLIIPLFMNAIMGKRLDKFYYMSVPSVHNGNKQPCHVFIFTSHFTCYFFTFWKGQCAVGFHMYSVQSLTRDERLEFSRENNWFECRLSGWVNRLTVAGLWAAVTGRKAERGSATEGVGDPETLWKCSQRGPLGKISPQASIAIPNVNMHAPYLSFFFFLFFVVSFFPSHRCKHIIHSYMHRYTHTWTQTHTENHKQAERI